MNAFVRDKISAASNSILQVCFRVLFFAFFGNVRILKAHVLLIWTFKLHGWILRGPGCWPQPQTPFLCPWNASWTKSGNQWQFVGDTPIFKAMYHPHLYFRIGVALNASLSADGVNSVPLSWLVRWICNKAVARNDTGWSFPVCCSERKVAQPTF